VLSLSLLVAHAAARRALRPPPARVGPSTEPAALSRALPAERPRQLRVGLDPRQQAARILLAQAVLVLRAQAVLEAVLEAVLAPRGQAELPHRPVAAQRPPAGNPPTLAGRRGPATALILMRTESS
jgi:hypothetical protein